MRIKKCNRQRPATYGQSGPATVAKSKLSFDLNSRQYQTGFTLVEILAVVAIIAVLVTIAISVASRLDAQNKINQTQETLALLKTALSEFHDYGFTYASGSTYANSSLTFPIDCNELNQLDTQTTLTQALGKTVTIYTLQSNNAPYSGIEAMYFLLGQVPQCQQTLEKIDKKFVVRDDRATRGDKQGEIDVTETDGTITKYPLIYIVDGWGTPIGYKYYNRDASLNIVVGTIKTFPVLTSAGPDKLFDTADDIKSR